jgi:hypothetical protein
MLNAVNIYQKRFCDIEQQIDKKKQFGAPIWGGGIYT